MAGFDADTSIYPKANPNALTDSASQFLGIANAAQQNQLLGTYNQQAHQDLVQKQVQYLAGGLGVLAKKPDLSSEDMIGFAQNAVKEGIISPETFQVEAANIAAAGGDPIKLQALATNYAQRALDAGQQFQTTFGANTSIDTGPNTVMGTQSPIHPFTPQATVANGLSPATAATPTTVPTIGPNGQPTGGTTLTTLGTFAGSVGGPGNSLTAPAQPAPGNSLTGAPASSPPPAAAPSAAIPGIPSVTPQQQKMYDASGAQYQGAKENDANYSANLVPLEKSLELLPNTPLFGKGAEIPTTIAQVLNTFGVPIGSDQSKNASELEKYLTQVGRNSGAAPHSDAQLIAAFSANPNMNTDKAAAQDVIKTMISLQRMQHATIAAAEAKGVSPEGYSDFARQLGSSQDPRAYGVDLMSPEAKQALLKDLQGNPAAKAKFIASLKIAAQAGVLGEPGSGQ